MPWRPGARRGRHEQVAGLPGPLFTLYCQLEAYCDSLLSGELGQVGDAGRATNPVRLSRRNCDFVWSLKEQLLS